MAQNLNLSIAMRSSMLQAIVTAIGSGGKLKFYSGSQPATVDTAILGQTKLAELALSTPAGTVSNGVLTFGSIAEDSAADATGTATWFTITKSDDTRVMDGTVGISDADMIIATPSFIIGAAIQCSSFTITGGNV